MKQSNNNSLELAPGDRIDKASYLPAYAQVANILKQKISKGFYQPGSRLPSEAAIAAGFGISAMTARQATGILAEEGLVDRIQGRGTFVKRLQFTSSSFGLDSLVEILTDKGGVSVRIIDVGVEAASPEIRARLQLKAGKSVILVKRLIFHRDEPLLFQASYAKADPELPFVETMLETDVLTGFMSQQDLSSFKKAEFKLLPATLRAEEAEHLQMPEGESAFKLEHVYYDFNDLPSACGWFLIAPNKMPLVCKMGVWNDD